MFKKFLPLIGLLAGMLSVQAQTQKAVKADETVVEVGKDEGYMTCDLPLNFSFQTSVALSLYSPEELMKGNISAVAFDGKFGQETTVYMQVYIGETDEKKIPFDREAFQARYIDVTTLTKVFDGDMRFLAGDHQEVRFDFTEPFAYGGERTLAVYTFARIEETLGYATNQFYASDYMGNPSMSISDVGMPSTPIDPLKPNESTSGYDDTDRPNTKFFFTSVSEEKHNLSFTVKDGDGGAIPDAVITLNGEKQETGKYVFGDMSKQQYRYMVEKDGFISAQGRLLLTKDTTVAVTLTSMKDYPGLSGFLFEDFENLSQGQRPICWSSDFYVNEEGGKDDGHCFTHNFWFMDGPRYIITRPIFMDSQPVLSFDYRVMEMDGQTHLHTGNAFTGENMSWRIEVSENLGETWKQIYNEDYGTHVSDKNYKPFSVDVSDYAGKVCLFQITVERDFSQEGDFFFDIDNLKIGTQLTHDLAVVTKIEGMRITGAGEKNAYVVCVRNQGKEVVENYSLKFYDGETEIGSVPGTKLESGAFTKLTYEHIFEQAGEHTLTAKCVMENDGSALNNTTPEFYVSVQPQGIRGSMVEAYEGEDMLWAAPVNMYDKNSLSWILYKKDDLAFEAGNTISGMAFRTKFAQAIDRMYLGVYIGETDSERLLEGVPAPTSLTKVFDGAVSVTDLDGGNFIINFDQVYRYTGKNLVVAFYKESSSSYNNDLDFGFYGCDITDFNAAVVMSMHSADPIDLSNVNLSEYELHMNAKFCNPSSIFLLNDNVSYYSVNFEVTDQNGNEISNATVTFDGTVMAAGKYKVENVPDGTYAYSVSLNGETVSGELTVNGADVVEKVQLQHVANESKEENMVSIYPNPTNGKLHIKVAEGAKEINLYDISGRTVRRLNRVPAGIIEVDLADCHSGIYLLMVDGKAFKVSKR